MLSNKFYKQQIIRPFNSKSKLVWSYFGLIFQKMTILTPAFDTKWCIKGPEVQEILQTMLQTMLLGDIKASRKKNQIFPASISTTSHLIG